MTEAAAAPAPGTAQPYADVLLNVGRPSLSAGSDMPVIDLAKPGQGEGEAPAEPATEPGIDADKGDPDTSGTSDQKTEGEADAPPNKEGGEEKDQTSPQQRAAFARERNKRQAAEQRATALEAQMAKLTEAVNKLAGEKDQPKEDPRPSRDTFTDPNAYDQALEDWAGRRATEKAKAEAKVEFDQQRQESHNKSILDTYKARETDFQSEHPDFEDVVYSDDVKITPVMTQAILEAEDGPAIAYHLGQNPDVAERIAGLSPAQQVWELGSISTKLAAPPPPQPKPKPEPIRPLNVRNIAAPKSPSEMSMDEYAEYRKSKST